MKEIFYAPAALAHFADMLEYTIQNFGEVQADACTARLAARVEALAAGTGPRARPCELLMQGVRDASGLTCYREGSHFLMLREKPDTLEVVEILHGRMNLDEHLERLAEELDPGQRRSCHRHPSVPGRSGRTAFPLPKAPRWPPGSPPLNAQLGRET